MGLLLCRDKDDEVVEYALSRNLSPALVAPYRLQRPDKKLIAARMYELLAGHEGMGEDDVCRVAVYPLRINVLLPNRLAIRSTASSAVWLRTSSAGFSSATSSEARRPVSAIISMHSCASR
jgi:hypothetical protein